MKLLVITLSWETRAITWFLISQAIFLAGLRSKCVVWILTKEQGSWSTFLHCVELYVMPLNKLLTNYGSETEIFF